MTEQTETSPLTKTSTELIVYQIGEIKTILTETKTEWAKFRDNIEKRVGALEIWQAGEIEREKTKQPLDAQKIIISALGIASAAIALALGLVQGGIIK